MTRVNSVLVVALVSAAAGAPSQAQSNDIPRRLRESVARSWQRHGHPSATAEFEIEKKITAGDGVAGEWFGWSVSISGDTAIVGVARDFEYNRLATSPGAAYLYQRNQGGPGNWGEVTKITGDGAPVDHFGNSVSISGDMAIVGAYLDLDDNGNRPGSAYVFHRNQGGADNWGKVTKITTSYEETNSRFGWSVAICGDSAIVGSWNDAAYVYQQGQGGADNWGEVAKFTDDDGGAYDLFGWSVSISGGTAIVGAIWDVDNGAAYVYQRDQGGADNWGKVTKITAGDGAFGDSFGESVSISEDAAIVGASDSAYVYQRDKGGADNWLEVTKITEGDGDDGDAFGISVAIYGDTAIVGAPFSEDNGAVYVYQRDQGGADNWGKVTKITAGDGAGGDAFGGSVSISGHTVIVGAYGNDDNDSDSGAAYVYFEVCQTDLDCDDGDLCNGIEYCDSQTGQCKAGAIDDCNGNGIDDACDLANCTNDPRCADCNDNGIPDECEPNCDGDGLIDDCDPDIDDDGIPNELDVCYCTPAGVPVDPEGRPLGDIDLDCDTDLLDFGHFQRGFTGPP